MSSVVVYDSGVGGLSIFGEVLAVGAHHDFVFLSDNAAYPYGTKRESELISRVTWLAECIAERYSPDILVVACNTASTVVLPLLRDKFDFHIVGVVPAIKPAAALSKTRHIGLLATPATIERDYTKRLIDEFASDCEVTLVGSSELVEMAEQRLRGIPADSAVLECILTPFLDAHDLDVLVLACTHFPLLNNEIRSVFDSNSRNISTLDSGAGVARRVAELGRQHSQSTTTAIAAFTAPLDEAGLFYYLASMKFSDIQILNL